MVNNNSNTTGLPRLITEPILPSGPTKKDVAGTQKVQKGWEYG